MKKYAVIQILGKQYKVSEGDTITLDRVPTEEKKNFDVNDVLMLVDDKNIKIGTPTVKGAKVTLKVLDNFRDAKIRVAKFKSKSRYRRVKGHRQLKSAIEVVKIS
jgi:large subunit ribosomal protein L21